MTHNSSYRNLTHAKTQGQNGHRYGGYRYTRNQTQNWRNSYYGEREGKQWNKENHNKYHREANHANNMSKNMNEKVQGKTNTCYWRPHNEQQKTSQPHIRQETDNFLGLKNQVRQLIGEILRENQPNQF